jgi:outer membrane protein OmpA-like peptidoglycan-associated protein
MKNAVAMVALLLGASVVGCGPSQPANPPPPPPVQPTPPPPPPPQQVAADNGDAVLDGDRIRVAKQIFYDVDKDAIRPESFPVLHAVAEILKAHPEITQLTVEGHTDNQGTVEHNIKLSKARADAVVRHLITVEAVRTPMLAPGYGAASPVCMEKSDDCNQKNRRVEFRVKR